MKGSEYITLIKEFLNKHLRFIYIFATVFYSEIILRAFTCAKFFRWSLITIFLFSAAFSLLVCAVISFFKERAARGIYIGVIAVTLINYATQVVYCLFFGRYLVFFSLVAGGTDQIFGNGMINATVTAILKGLPAIALLTLPLIIYFLFVNRRITFKRLAVKESVIFLVCSVVIYPVLVFAICLFPKTADIYTSAFDNVISVRNFGLIETERLDFKYNILGFKQSNNLAEEKDDEKRQEKYSADKYNIMDIDFDSLIAEDTNQEFSVLDTYFSAQTPTEKNEMTGKYADYNVIQITAEAFSPYAIDEKLTPTLYKMKQNGISFGNYYAPLWGVSTSDGEYVNCTGLLPKSGVWSMYLSGTNYLPFCLGNQFKKLSVDTRYAFHNHSYVFYHRDVSHTNMGYEYIANGNGLEKYLTAQMPESDLEMINATVPMYLKSGRFCTYYMTVSGHLSYTFENNAMASKNRAAVQKLPYSDTIKAYLACNIEFDRAMGKLLSDLEESGKADKTLIVIAPDHYPYGLEDDAMDDKYHYINELAGHNVETNFELYKSELIIYSPSMTEGRKVDKFCSSLDILPTVSNMLGLEYDSRLLMGKDVFSNSSELVIFADRSFITDKGMYNANTEEFIPSGNFDGDLQAYLDKTNAVVKNKFKISMLMLENDYYAHAFGVKKEE